MGRAPYIHCIKLVQFLCKNLLITLRKTNSEKFKLVNWYSRLTDLVASSPNAASILSSVPGL